MSADIGNHRLGAFIYGFVSGLGFVMVLWGLASVAVLPRTNVSSSIWLTLLGVGALAIGVCREAYLRGYLLEMARTDKAASSHPTQPPPVSRRNGYTMQLVDYPFEAREKPLEEG